VNAVVEAVGFVRGPRRKVEDDFWGGEEATILLADQVPAEAIQGLEAFSHVEVVSLFPRVDGAFGPRGRFPIGGTRVSRQDGGSAQPGGTR